MLGPRAILLAMLSLPEPIAITTHIHADMDGASSIYALNRLLKEFGKDSFPMLFEPSAEAKRLESYDREYSSAIVVDTHKPSRCPIKADRIVIIDHHEPEETRQGAIKRIDPSKASTAEMVALIFKENSIEPPKDVAEKLLLGIMSDTKNFLYASRRSFEAAEYLRRFTDEPAEFYEERLPISARIASIKAAQRAEMYRIGDRILLLSHVSAYESKAASDLLRLGADVSIVYSKSRVVVRSREPLLRLAKTLGFKDVGGHNKAFVVQSDDPKRDAEKLKEAVLDFWKRSDETKKPE